MTAITEDIMKAAREAYLSAFNEFGNAKDHEVYAAIAAALLAERKRCAAIIRSHGALDYGDQDVSERVSEGAIEEIMKGGEA